MILGAIPLALATGAGAESRQQIGWVIVGGMAFGTLFTLFVVPDLLPPPVRRSPAGPWRQRRKSGGTWPTKPTWPGPRGNKRPTPFVDCRNGVPARIDFGRNSAAAPNEECGRIDDFGQLISAQIPARFGATPMP